MVYMGGFQLAFGYISNHPNIKIGDYVIATDEEIKDNESIEYNFTHIRVEKILGNQFLGSAVIETILEIWFNTTKIKQIKGD